MASDSNGGHPAGLAAASEDRQAASPLLALKRWVRQTLSSRPDHSLKSALEEVLDEHHDTGESVVVEEMNLLRNMIAFGELTVGDVMIPRTDILAVPETIEFEALKSYISEHQHTRVPVYNESLDNVTGFVHIKDIMLCLINAQPFDMARLRRDILFVPASMKIVDLLLKMRLSSCHMAIVIDEYGGTDGLVTMEDLFEEIVGEIHDEHDEAEDEPQIRWLSEKALEADARVEIDELSEQLDMDLINGHDAEDIETVGGLIFSHLGRIPAKGEVIQYGDGLRFEILSADPRRIRKVKIIRQSPLAPTPSV